MQSKIFNFFITFVIVALCAVALTLAFGMPIKAAAACAPSAVYMPCNDVYANPTQYRQFQQYPTLEYRYYQDPARYARQPYVPVVYPIPLYVQTGANPANANYGSYSQQYPGLNYASYNSPSYGTPTYGTYPLNNYGSTYGGNTGFTLTGGSQANYGGATSGGFINTSGR